MPQVVQQNKCLYRKFDMYKYLKYNIIITNKMEKHFNALDKKQASLEHQDWKQVVINPKKNTSAKQGGTKPTKVLSQSQQRETSLLKKAENDDLKHTKITNELRTKIIQGRASQKWKQKDLAQKCNLPVSIINEIESGKAIYNPQHINKIKRILKI